MNQALLEYFFFIAGLLHYMGLDFVSNELVDQCMLFRQTGIENMTMKLIAVPCMDNKMTTAVPSED